MFLVAVECQSRWRKEHENKLDVEKRAYFDRSTYGTDAARVRESRGRDSDALDDVEFARREMAQMHPDDEREAPRMVRFEVGPIYGLKKKIVADVAHWASAKFGKAVSPGVVRSAWALAERESAEDV